MIQIVKYSQSSWPSEFAREEIHSKCLQSIIDVRKPSYSFMDHVIYGLYSTRNGTIRYVGESSDAESRLRQHLSPVYYGKRLKRPLSKWIGEEFFKGYSVEVVVLEKCHYSERYLREMSYIAKFENLLNEQHKELIGFYKDRNDQESQAIQEANQKIELSTKSAIWNYGGFAGIQYLGPYRYMAQACVKIVTERYLKHPDGFDIPYQEERYALSDVQNPEGGWVFDDPKVAIEARDSEVCNLKNQYFRSNVLTHPDQID